MAHAFRATWLVLILCVTLASSTVDVSAQGAGGWVRLLAAGTGSAASQPVTSISLARDWPTTRMILAQRGDRVLRTLDGGTTWDDVGPAPGDRLMLETFAGSRVALAASKTGLHRSTDDGATWQHVLPLTDATRATWPTLSRQFSADGRGVVEVEGRLYVTTDGGVTWPQVEPAPGQNVTWVGFWPDSGPSRDLYALVRKEGFGLAGSLYRGGDGGWQPVEAVAGRDIDIPSFADGGRVLLSVSSLSTAPPAPVFVSSDNGETWSQVGTELVVGDEPHKIDTSVISPEIADDGTIFVSTLGADRTRPTLFRGDAMGTTWTHLAGAPLARTGVQQARMSLSLSSRFAEDRTAMLVSNTSQGTPSSGECSIARTTDGGTTWTSVYSERRATCFVGDRVGPGGVEWRLWSSNPGGQEQKRSTDGGQNWQYISAGTGGVATITDSPQFASDGTMLVGTRGGEIWAQGPGLQATDGRVGQAAPASQASCPSQPVGGFGRVWSSEPGLRERLGCPSRPEAPVDIRVNRDGDVLRIWVEDESDMWFEIHTGEGRYTRRSKQTDAADWQANPGGVMAGSAQPFANGTMVFLPGDGTRTIVVLDSQGKSQELPD
jgi:photosystem II stability/assembly factor-like uncharacterized protein